LASSSSWRGPPHPFDLLVPTGATTSDLTHITARPATAASSVRHTPCNRSARRIAAPFFTERFPNRTDYMVPTDMPHVRDDPPPNRLPQ
jgi:hypothetical protein